MVVSVVRVVLCRVVFRYDRIGSQVQEQARVFTDDLADPLLKPVMRHHLPDDKVCADLKAAASCRCRKLLRKLGIREELKVVPVRDHHARVIFAGFPDRRALWNSILSVSVIIPSVFVINICRSLDLFLRDPALLLRNFNFKIEIHGSSFRVLINLVKFYHISPYFAILMPVFPLK